MNINIINLAHRVDRLKLLEDELTNQNIHDYTIWPGIINPYIASKGISQAHKQIIRYAKENELKEILIAEDDLKFTSKGAFNYFLNNKPNEYDIYLASVYFGEISAENIVSDFAGLTFYIVHERFYDTFLAIPEHDNLDRSLRGKGKFVVCNPFTVIQKNGFSDNIKDLCDYSNHLKGRELFNDNKT